MYPVRYAGTRSYSVLMSLSANFISGLRIRYISIMGDMVLQHKDQLSNYTVQSRTFLSYPK